LAPLVMTYARTSVVGVGAGVVVVGDAGFVVVVDGVDEAEAAAAVAVGVSIAPPLPAVGPQALSTSAPAASAVTRPAPAFIPVPCPVPPSDRPAARMSCICTPCGDHWLTPALALGRLRSEAAREGSSPYALPERRCSTRRRLEQIVIKA
jgi:hypothetical protein